MRLLGLFISLLFGTHAFAQERNEKELLLLLNNILSSSSHHHWVYEGLPMEVDSPFAFRNGLLTMTVRYKTDSAAYRLRLEAPLQKLHSVEWDVYLILYYKNKEVTVFDSTAAGWEEADHRNQFHVGLPVTEHTADSLRQLLGTYLNRKDLLPAAKSFTDDQANDPDLFGHRMQVICDDKPDFVEINDRQKNKATMSPYYPSLLMIPVNRSINSIPRRERNMHSSLSLHKP